MDGGRTKVRSGCHERPPPRATRAIDVVVRIGQFVRPEAKNSKLGNYVGCAAQHEWAARISLDAAFSRLRQTDGDSREAADADVGWRVVDGDALAQEPRRGAGVQ